MVGVLVDVYLNCIQVEGQLRGLVHGSFYEVTAECGGRPLLVPFFAVFILQQYTFAGKSIRNRMLVKPP